MRHDLCLTSDSCTSTISTNHRTSVHGQQRLGFSQEYRHGQFDCGGVRRDQDILASESDPAFVTSLRFDTLSDAETWATYRLAITPIIASASSPIDPAESHA